MHCILSLAALHLSVLRYACFPEILWLQGICCLTILLIFEISWMLSLPCGGSLTLECRPPLYCFFCQNESVIGEYLFLYPNKEIPLQGRLQEKRRGKIRRYLFKGGYKRRGQLPEFCSGRNNKTRLIAQAPFFPFLYYSVFE